MDYSLAEKAAVHDAFEALLDALDAADREPDRWEEDCLVQALAAMACGTYRHAAVELQVFSTPGTERSGDSLLHLNSTPQKFTKEQLRYGLSRMRLLAIAQE